MEIPDFMVSLKVPTLYRQFIDNKVVWLCLLESSVAKSHLLVNGYWGRLSNTELEPGEIPRLRPPLPTYQLKEKRILLSLFVQQRHTYDIGDLSPTEKALCDRLESLNNLMEEFEGEFTELHTCLSETHRQLEVADAACNKLILANSNLIDLNATLTNDNNVLRDMVRELGQLVYRLTGQRML